MSTVYNGTNHELNIQKLVCHNLDVSGKINTSGPLSITNLLVKDTSQLNGSTVVGTDENQESTEFTVKGTSYMANTQIFGVATCHGSITYPPIFSISGTTYLTTELSDRPIYLNNLTGDIDVYLTLGVSGLRFTFVVGGNYLEDTLGYDVNIFAVDDEKIIGYINNSGGKTKIRTGKLTMTNSLSTGDFISISQRVNSNGNPDTACWFITGGGDSVLTDGFIYE
jgi:hypothetical protein